MRLAILCHPKQAHFLGPLVGALRERGLTVRQFPAGAGPPTRGAFEWGDVIWAEWATEGAWTASLVQHLERKPLVVRLHSYEAFTPWVRKIQWHDVARCVFVSDHMREIAHKEAPTLDDTTSVVIPNGVDLAKFPLQPINVETDRIGVVANITGKKGPMLWLDVLARLPEPISLHVAGRMDDRRYVYYFQNMAAKLGVADRFHLDGYVEDILEWWRDKNYVLSTSPHEGCPMNLLEAMALGKVPIVHEFVGARDLMPEYAAADKPTAEGLAEAVMDAVDVDPETYGFRAHRHVVERFSLSRQADAVAAMLEGL